MKDLINGCWESVFETLENLDPKKKHGITFDQDIKFKANAIITLNFEKQDSATIEYEFDNIKPI